MTCLHPVFLACALASVGLALVVTLFARPVLRRTSRIFFLIGLLLLALAAGGPAITLHPIQQVTVMVDLSPSMRGSIFRNRTDLDRRIRELVGQLPIHLLGFSDHTEKLPSESTVPERSCEQTMFDPPGTDPILLFSDGQFALPKTTGAQMYPVIDPGLEQPNDAAVTELYSDTSGFVARVRNRSSDRALQWTGTSTTLPCPYRPLARPSFARTTQPPTSSPRALLAPISGQRMMH